MRRTPRRFVHLLDDLGQSELAGDLAEEFSAGRSRGWLRWQVGAGIIAALCNTIRRHPYLTLRAVAVGWTTWILVEGFGRLPFFLRPEFPEWVREAPFFWPAWDAAAFLLRGWVVARLHRQTRFPLVLVTMLSMELVWALFLGRYTYDLLTHPAPVSPLLEQRLMFHSVIPYTVPLLVLNSVIPLLLPLLVVAGGRLAGTLGPQLEE
jgi:hypothetical protein